MTLPIRRSNSSPAILCGFNRTSNSQPVDSDLIEKAKQDSTSQMEYSDHIRLARAIYLYRDKMTRDGKEEKIIPWFWDDSQYGSTFFENTFSKAKEVTKHIWVIENAGLGVDKFDISNQEHVELLYTSVNLQNSGDPISTTNELFMQDAWTVDRNRVIAHVNGLRSIVKTSIQTTGLLVPGSDTFGQLALLVLERTPLLGGQEDLKISAEDIRFITGRDKIPDDIGILFDMNLSASAKDAVAKAVYKKFSDVTQSHGDRFKEIDEKLVQLKSDIELGNADAIIAISESIQESFDKLSVEHKAEFNKIHQQLADRNAEAAKQEKQKETQRKLNFAAGVASAVEGSLKGIQGAGFQRDHRKDQRKERTRAFEQRGKRVISSIEKPLDDTSINPFDISMQLLGKESQNIDEALRETRGLLNIVKESLVADESIEGGLGNCRHILKKEEEALVKTYNKLEQERNKLCSAHENFGLGANLISNAVSIIPVGGGIAASILRGINTAIQIRGNSKDRRFKEEGESLLKGMDRFEKKGAFLQGLQYNHQASNQQSNAYHEALKKTERELLRRDPKRFSEYLSGRQSDLQQRVIRGETLKTQLREELKKLPIEFKKLSFEELREKDPALAKKYSNATNREFLLDVSRGVIVISDHAETNGGLQYKRTFHAYQIGNDNPLYQGKMDKIRRYIGNVDISEEAIDETVKNVLETEFKDPNLTAWQIRIKDIRDDLRTIEGYGDYSGEIKFSKKEIAEEAKDFANKKLEETLQYAEMAKNKALSKNVPAAFLAAKDAKQAAVEAQEYAIEKQIEQIQRLDKVIATGEQNVQSQNSPKAAHTLALALEKRQKLSEGLEESYENLHELDPTKASYPKGPQSVIIEGSSPFSNLSPEDEEKAVADVTTAANRAKNLADTARRNALLAETLKRQLAPLEECQKFYTERWAFVNKLVTQEREDEVFRKFEETNWENTEGKDNLLKLFAKSLGQGLQLIAVWDNVFSEEGEEILREIPLRSPEVIMKSAEFLGHMSEFFCAFHSFRALVKGYHDSKKASDEATIIAEAQSGDEPVKQAAKQAEAIIKVFNGIEGLDKQVKTAMIFLNPLCQCLVIGSELYSIWKAEPYPPNPYLDELAKLQTNMNAHFDFVNSKLERISEDLRKGFSEAREHLELVETNLKQTVTEEADRVKSGLVEETVKKEFRDVRTRVLASRSEVYHGYFSGFRGGLNQKESSDILSTIEIRSFAMIDRAENGLWLEEGRKISRMFPVERFPQHATGFLMSYICGQVEGVPNFFHMSSAHTFFHSSQRNYCLKGLQKK